MSPVNDSAFFDAVGGQASIGPGANDGQEVGMSILPLPDGTLRLNFAHEDGAAGFHYLVLEVPSGMAAEWGMLLSAAARAADGS